MGKSFNYQAAIGNYIFMCCSDSCMTFETIAKVKAFNEIDNTITADEIYLIFKQMQPSGEVGYQIIPNAALISNKSKIEGSISNDIIINLNKFDIIGMVNQSNDILQHIASVKSKLVTVKSKSPIIGA
jgi:hypothetical protein